MFALYHLDIYVTQLMLNRETYIDSGGASLLAKVVFLNFPALEIAERNRYHKNDEDDIFVFEFHAGHTFHFSMPCEELVKKMKKVPLNIGIFRVDDYFPFCKVRTFLNGCACDLGTLLVEKPKPFVFRGPFDLEDIGNSFAGQMAVDITITNMGRHLITHYGLAPSCFLYKNELDGVENHCSTKEGSIGFEELGASVQYNLAKITMKLDMASPGEVIRDIAGIAAAADHLARGKPPPKPPREPLVDPTAKRTKKKKKKGKKKR